MPVLHISGWYDDEEILAPPANFAALVAAGRAGQRLLMGPWGHAVNTTRTLGELSTSAADALIDLDGTSTHAFLDEHVKGVRPEAPPAPVRIFVMGARRMARRAQAWPPRGCAVRGLPFRRRAGQQPVWRRPGWSRRKSRPISRRTSGPMIPAGRCPFITDANIAQIGGPDDYLGVESRGDCAGVHQ